MKLDFEIPVMAPRMEPLKMELPISQRENLMLALNHQKPKWMPIIFDATQFVFPSCHQDSPGGPSGQGGDGYDWFGTFYKYEEKQAGTTPIPGMFEEIGQWREKVKWPDLDAVDWRKDLPGFVRDPDKALATRLGTGAFERLHAFESFEQSLCDILTEPEECKAFFDAMGNYRVECMKRLQEVYHFDYFINHDDWSNARAPFFSCQTFEETLLDSAVAVAQAAHDLGAKYIAHCCGKMDAWVPYFADVIHADSLEIQNDNDIRAMLDKYGEKLTPMYALDQFIMYNPATTAEQARAYARELVDKYGAHTCDGAGIVIRMHGNHPESYYAFEEELYRYSLEKYAAL